MWSRPPAAFRRMKKIDSGGLPLEVPRYYIATVTSKASKSRHYLEIKKKKREHVSMSGKMIRSKKTVATTDNLWTTQVKIPISSHPKIPLCQETTWSLQYIPAFCHYPGFAPSHWYVWLHGWFEKWAGTILVYYIRLDTNWESRATTFKSILKPYYL